MPQPLKFSFAVVVGGSTLRIVPESRTGFKQFCIEHPVLSSYLQASFQPFLRGPKVPDQPEGFSQIYGAPRESPPINRSEELYRLTKTTGRSGVVLHFSISDACSCLSHCLRNGR